MSEMINQEAVQEENVTPTPEIPTNEASVTEAGGAEGDAESFKAMLDKSFTSLHTGKIVRGEVVRVTPTEVIVDLGYKSDGIISKAEFSEDQSVCLTEKTRPGDIYDVFVIRVNDGDGNVLVSKKKVDNQINYRELEQAFTEKTVLPGKVTDVVKGGLIANILGCRAFVPASQISGRFEQNLESFKGKEFDFHIMEFDIRKRRIIAGRKELAIQEAKKRREEVFGNIKVGEYVQGTVSRLVDFGAFVDIGGVDGLIHVSEVSWKRVRKPSDVLSAGQEVNALVIAVDPDKNKISLSLKNPETNPWSLVPTKYPLGEIIEGTVVRLASFGAFVNLEDGIDGLVHISQIADKHIAKPDDELKPGQVIKVKVMDIDIKNQKISLSKREADAALGLGDDSTLDVAEEEVEAPETPEPVGEAAAPEVPEPIEEAAAPETSEPVGEVATPEAPEPVEEVATPETPEPVEEVATPETPEPIEEAVAPEAPEPIEEAVAPETPEPIEKAVAPETPEPIEEAVATETPEPIEEAIAPEPVEEV